MPQDTDARDPNMPNQGANNEKAEGSRETTNEGGGISNRPADEERARQENLPPRGTTRDAAPEPAHRDSVAHDRQSHIVNPGAEENARRDDADEDPVMPTGDSTLKTDI